VCSTPSVCTAWKYVPTDELAGDAIGLTLIDDRYLVAYVLDVSGHGVPAALLSVTAMHALEPDPAETSLLRDVARTGNDAAGFGTVQRPSRVAMELNRRFRAGENDGRYLTMILCVLDTHDGRLRVTSAGHPTPLLLRGREAIDVPDAGGFPIAIFDVADYEDELVQLHPGDRLCLFSDGIAEQPKGPGEGEQFGVGRLRESLASRSAAPAVQAADAVIDDLTAWAACKSFVDDVSIVLIEWRGVAPAAAQGGQT